VIRRGAGDIVALSCSASPIYQRSNVEPLPPAASRPPTYCTQDLRVEDVAETKTFRDQAAAQCCGFSISTQKPHAKPAPAWNNVRYRTPGAWLSQRSRICHDKIEEEIGVPLDPDQITLLQKRGSSRSSSGSPSTSRTETTCRVVNSRSQFRRFGVSGLSAGMSNPGRGSGYGSWIDSGQATASARSV